MFNELPIPVGRIRGAISHRISHDEMKAILHDGLEAFAREKRKQKVGQVPTETILFITECRLIWELLVNVLLEMRDLVHSSAEPEIMKECIKLEHRAFQYIYNIYSNEALVSVDHKQSLPLRDEDFLYFFISTDLQNLAARWEKKPWYRQIPSLEKTLTFAEDFNRMRYKIGEGMGTVEYDLGPYEHAALVGAGPQLVAYEKWERLLDIDNDLDLWNLAICSAQCLYVLVQTLHREIETAIPPTMLDTDLAIVQHNLDVMTQTVCKAVPTELKELHPDALQNLFWYMHMLSENLVPLLLQANEILKEQNLRKNIPVSEDIMERVTEFQYLWELIRSNRGEV